MADPISIAAITIASMSAVVSGAGVYASVAGQRKMLDYQIAQNEEYAKYEEGVAKEQANDLRDRNRRLMATSAAARGASGVTMEGSPMKSMLDFALTSEVDALRLEQHGAARAGKLRAESNLFGLKKEIATTEGIIRGAGTLTNFASSLSSFGGGGGSKPDSGSPTVINV